MSSVRRPRPLTLAGSADDIDDKKADITLTMAKPLPAKLVPAVGTLTQFQATVTSYTPSPFMLTMTEGVLLDKAGNPVGTPRPRRTKLRLRRNRSRGIKIAGAIWLPLFCYS